MAELLFGTGPQLWPALPVPGFGHPATFPANRPAIIVQGSAQDPSSAPVNPTMSPAFDFNTGITPQALLATVAMRRGQPGGPSNDQDVEDFVYDALDLLPGGNDIEVRCDLADRSMFSDQMKTSSPALAPLLERGKDWLSVACCLL